MSIYFLIFPKKKENEKEKKRKKVQSGVSINSKTFEGNVDEVWGRNHVGQK